MNKVDVSGDSCWAWGAAKDKDGYGLFQNGSKLVRAHRFSYQAHHGKIPDGKIVLHACDNPSCVNPAHLSVGTHSDNARQREERNRRRNLIGSDRSDALLTEETAAAIKSAECVNQQELAERYGVSRSVVYKIRAGKSWKHVDAPLGKLLGRWPEKKDASAQRITVA